MKGEDKSGVKREDRPGPGPGPGQAGTGRDGHWLVRNRPVLTQPSPAQPSGSGSLRWSPSTGPDGDGDRACPRPALPRAIGGPREGEWKGAGGGTGPGARGRTGGQVKHSQCAGETARPTSPYLLTVGTAPPLLLAMLLQPRRAAPRRCRTPPRHATPRPETPAFISSWHAWRAMDGLRDGMRPEETYSCPTGRKWGTDGALMASTSTSTIHPDLVRPGRPHRAAEQPSGRRQGS